MGKSPSVSPEASGPLFWNTQKGGGVRLFSSAGNAPGVPEAACLFCKVSGIFRQILEHSPPTPPLFNGSSCALEAGTDKKFRSFLGDRPVGGAGGGFIGCHGDCSFWSVAGRALLWRRFVVVAGTLSGSGLEPLNRTGSLGHISSSCKFVWSHSTELEHFKRNVGTF